MAITASSLVNETLTLIIDNGKQIITAKSDHPRWSAICQAYKAGYNGLLQELVSLKTVVENYSVGKLSVNSAGVTYAGRPMHTVDSHRVMAFLKNGLPFKPIAKYIEKKAQNPSKRAIDEMYNFLENKFMPLTDDGTFIAYRGVQNDYWLVNGNLDTVVLQGKVNEKGQIFNKIGDTIEVERSSVDDNKDNDCGAGLHIGSLEYAKGWGKRVILVEVNPADVVSIPENCGCSKMRCCKYKIIGEYKYPLDDVYTDKFSEPEPQNKSKFANDSHTKLKRDKNGKFLKKDNSSVLINETPTIENLQDAIKTSVNYKKSQLTDAGLTFEDAILNADIGIFPTQKVESIDLTAPIHKINMDKWLYIASVWKKIKNITDEYFADYIVDKEITLDTKVSDIGMDSLDGIEIVMAYEELFQIEILDEDAEEFYINKELKFAHVVDSIIRQIIKSNGTNYNNEFYTHGLVDGVNHREANATALYVIGDEKDTDSIEQKNYIIGYLNGYQFENFPIN